MNDPMSIVLCLPDGTDFFDPVPDVTRSKDVRLVETWEEDTRGVVGWSTGGWDALRLAAEHPDLPRLVLLSLPYDEDTSMDLDAVAAKTLLLFGSADPDTGSRHGTHWQKRLANARLEMVPGGGHDLLEQMWHRVLSHLAPRRKAPGR